MTGAGFQRLCQALIRDDHRSTGLTIGLTGPWGCGKSSVLNLLEEFIERTYSSAIVFRFDPWIVSGREDLISRFFADLTSIIKKKHGASRAFLDLAGRLSEYGDEISGLVDPLAPRIGAGIKLIARLVRKRSGDTPHEKKKKIAEALSGVNIPLIVMIDDLDRLDDTEVQAMAQLVRSVADFPQISYILAYDELRIAQALGAGKANSIAYGRAYLEKIVQLQIPLPLTLPQEIRLLLLARLDEIAGEGAFESGWRNHSRFNNLLELLEEVIQTPRDIQRLIGAIKAREAMLRGEVHWIDVIGFCALELKAPDTVAGLRVNYEFVIVDASFGHQMLVYSKKETEQERLRFLVPKHERKTPNFRLLHFLFPAIRGVTDSVLGPPDAVSFRRPLLTRLRLGLLPGAVSRAQVYDFLRGGKDNIDSLKHLALSGGIGAFFDRLEDVYLDAPEVAEDVVWSSLGQLAEERLDGQILASTLDSAISFTILRLAMRSEVFRLRAASIVETMISNGFLYVPACILLDHVYGLGLFGQERRGLEYPLFRAEGVEALVTKIGRLLQERMLDPLFIRRLANGRPFALLVHSNQWDEKRKELLGAALGQAENLDCFVGVSFSADHQLSEEFIEKLVGNETLRALVSRRMRCEDFGSLAEGLQVVYEKTAGRDDRGATEQVD